ncbi:hypothetical protein FQR65_LT17859 [Abscondita terminalis]|nr:hypothetical protein FQR65_LT17859 [Abscondita terminalis]
MHLHFFLQKYQEQICQFVQQKNNYLQLKSSGQPPDDTMQSNEATKIMNYLQHIIRKVNILQSIMVDMSSQLNDLQTKSNNNDVEALSDTCELIDKIRLCPKRNRINQNATCIENILIKNYFEECLYVKLPKKPLLEFIPETNQYLGCFPEPVTLKSNCSKIMTTQKINGILLFSDNPNCDYSIKTDQLIFNDEGTGHPMVIETIEDTKLTLPKIQFQEMGIKPINLRKLSNNLQPLKILEDDDLKTSHLSATIVL